MLTDKEKNIILDTDFLTSKIEITKKIQTQLERTRIEIKNVIEKSNFPFSDNIDITSGKIFRGENYRSLPYLVLDYPKYFSKENSFTYRTMFWWGNFFSSTLHIEGEALRHYEIILLKNMNEIIAEKVYITVGITPWEYHYGESNYTLANLSNISKITDRTFLKLSKRFNISDFDNLPKLSASYFSFLLKVLSE